MKRRLLLALAIVAAPATAQAAPAQPAAGLPLQQRVEALLSSSGPGPRFGLVVATLDGRELVAIAPEQRFIPASNTKLFPTAAAFELLGEAERGGPASGTIVRLRPGRRGPPDVLLEGRGDGRLSAAPECRRNCLAELADAVAARSRRVGNVIGDARFFPDERWSQGMSWNNIPTSSGTALAALTLDRNELALRVTPGEAGQPPRLELSPYYTLDNRAVTVAADGGKPLSVQRMPGSRHLVLTGTVRVGAEPRLIRLGIDDPAHHAAWQLAQMLAQRGVRVTGTVQGLYHAQAIPAEPSPPPPPILAALDPGPLAEELTTINKASQNLLSELLLRRLGNLSGEGSAEAGVEKIGLVLDRAGVPRGSVHLADGSGMSTYNRVTPRATVALLRWAAGRPWGEAFRATLPIGGVDGTLAQRFRGTALHGRVFAKTGSLNATNALAGYLLTRRGETLVFAIYANDVPETVRATPLMDRALELIALEH